MKINRRDLLIGGSMALLTGGRRQAAGAVAASPPIDRRSVVARHNPVVGKADPFSALTVGNGSFAFTADVTGLQSFPDAYRKDFPLCTAAHWAWHTTPIPAGLHAEDYKFKAYETYGRKVGYATEHQGQEALFKWLRENPHRLHLGLVGLVFNLLDGAAVTIDQLSGIDQTLDLWTGKLTSQFLFAGKPVTVRTAAHPALDALAISVESSLLASGELTLRVAFPYGSPDMDMADWDSPARHQTTCSEKNRRVDMIRTLDQDHYSVAVSWNDGMLTRKQQHEWILTTPANRLECVIAFSSDPITGPLPTVDSTFTASLDHWQNFWSTGGAIDFSACTDPRAFELERRVILSQFNTSLHCAGPMPPPETGLLCNSWYGKSHLEMHWWHSVHFAAWGRLPLLEKSLGYYQRIMPVAKATAVRQGYDGVRWPKMVDAQGHDSPSPIAPLLIWQQPHPIYYAEICYRAHPTPKTLNSWAAIVQETAQFMASYAVLDHGRYVLGPPIKTVSENADTNTTINPTFELTYWRFGLETAQLWRTRQGLAPDEHWADVLTHLSPLPLADGLYLMQENMPDTYTAWNWEHPALLGALGMQPGVGVDLESMRHTLKKVMQVWQWDRCWGWDFPMAALTAARLGEGALALDALMIESVKNRYLPNGHVYQRPNLPAYLPGNGGLLAAIAVMAVTPNGFPTDGKWNIRWEGLNGLI